MRIGVPKEIKDNENRVAITPSGVQMLHQAGHEVYIETAAGLESGFQDHDYQSVGAIILNNPAEVWEKSEMILKVKEPLPEEYHYFREGLIVFAYLHLANEKELADAFQAAKMTALGYETVQLENKSLPLLTPMSEVAGRMSIQVGAHFLEKQYGGKGLLLGGVPGVLSSNVIIIGGGIVGTNAAKMAMGLGANVSIIDISTERLRYLDDIFGSSINVLMSNSFNIARAVKTADLLIGAVLIAGAKAPTLVTEEMVKSMEPGSVIVDVAIDQGGIVETMDRSSTHNDPIYFKHDIIHYAVSNMPGAVSQTSTLALTNHTIPYALEIANQGIEAVVLKNSAIAKGVNVYKGNIVHEAVAKSLNLTYVDLNSLIS